MEKKFVQGLFVKYPHPNAPKFVLAKMAVKVDEFIQYLEENQDDKGWVNLILKESQKGTLYFDLDTWKPNNSVERFKPKEGEQATMYKDPQQSFNNQREIYSKGDDGEIKVENIPFN